MFLEKRITLKMTANNDWRIIYIFLFVWRVTKVSLADNECQARIWLEKYNSDAEKISYETMEARWAYNTNLTNYNQEIYEEKATQSANFIKLRSREANEFDWKSFNEPLLKRRFSKIVDVGLSSLPDDDFQKMTEIISNMERIYSTAKVCNKPNDNSGTCYPLDPDLTSIIAKSEDMEELEWAWKGWRDASGRLMPNNYSELADLLNKAAHINGYEDNGAYWRSWYESETFRDDCEALWQEVKPLYEQLHAYTRRKLKQKYPHLNFPSQGHIPAHILGNMWAHSWNNIKVLLMPDPSIPAMDVTIELKRQNYTAEKIFRLAEDFFKSLGLKPMPQTFWDKSMIVKPDDREVVCHASAWDFFNKRDFRIKQCTEVDTKWLFTTHHEMGHVEYFLHYLNQPIEFRSGANPGFHEAIGDVASLSVSTPEHLQSVGLLHNFLDDPNGDLNFLMDQALTKVAFLPYGYLVDQWRWDIFSGRTNRSDYNKNWWKARCKYQGVMPPVRRSEEDFDAGSKFHVPSNTPYIRYFVAHIIQFQFHEALCRVAGNTRPLHRCDISNSAEAGRKLGQLLTDGASRPWPDVLQDLTGSDRMSASPLIEYYRPLMDWLKVQNEGHEVGWDESCPPGSFQS